MALMAASQMNFGVGKSGSPKHKLMMSSPFAMSSSALAETASVAEGLSASIRFAVISILFLISTKSEEPFYLVFTAKQSNFYFCPMSQESHLYDKFALLNF